ncbi:MAG TPA: hypothetical protein VF342_10515 [Alphaproteobacteria bacterium]
MIGRWLGWAFLALALAMAAYDVWVFLDTGAIAPLELGRVWYAIHPGSLNLVQAVIERYVHPFLWDPVIFTLLLQPAAVVFGVIGLVLVLVFRRRKRRWRSGAFD